MRSDAMELVQRLIVEIRALRKETGIEEKAITTVEVRTDVIYEGLFKESSAIVERLARVSNLSLVREITTGLAKHPTAAFDVGINRPTIDVAAERERLTRDIGKYEKGLAAAERQLGNENFMAKAPSNVVEGLKKQESETRLLLEKARAALDALPSG